MALSLLGLPYLIPRILILIIPSPCSPFCYLVSRGSMVNKYHGWPVSALVSIQIRLAVNFYPPSLPEGTRLPGAWVGKDFVFSILLCILHFSCFTIISTHYCFIFRHICFTFISAYLYLHLFL